MKHKALHFCNLKILLFVFFVRLEKTKTELTEKEIEKLIFENSESKFKIAFNVELQKPILLEISKGRRPDETFKSDVSRIYLSGVSSVL